MNVKIHTNAYKIFHYEYHCRVPLRYVIDIEKLAVMGSYTRGSVEADAQTADEIQNVVLTIADMVKIREQEGFFELVDPEKAVVIYDIICGHLKDHIENLQGSSMAPAPLEDLKKLDALASDIWQVARQFVVVETTSNDLIKTIMEMNPLMTSIDVEMDIPESHKTLTSMMNASGLDRNNRW